MWSLNNLLLFIVVLGSSIAEELRYQPYPVDDDVGHLLSNPRLAFHPNPDGKSTLIRYITKKPSTYKEYVDALNKKLAEYHNSRRWRALKSGDLIDCSSYDKYRPPYMEDKVCYFNFEDLGTSCVKVLDYGYNASRPCVLFNMDRVFSWLPSPYSNSMVPGMIHDLWSQYYVTLKCDGATNLWHSKDEAQNIYINKTADRDASSRDNIGQLNYYPKNGFAFKYFPYTGQPEWLPPLVFVQFDSITPSLLVRVVCQVFASNIFHSQRLDTGMVNFELLVD